MGEKGLEVIGKELEVQDEGSGMRVQGTKPAVSDGGNLSLTVGAVLNSSLIPHPSSLIIPPMSASPRQIGIAIVEHAGNCLVGFRGPDQVLAGRAEFPGGKCEPGESPGDCAVRECLEETGMAVIAERLLHQAEFRYPHGDVALHFWHCRPADRSQVRADHRGFRWVPLGELGSMNFPEANRDVIVILTSATPRLGG